MNFIHAFKNSVIFQIYPWPSLLMIAVNCKIFLNFYFNSQIENNYKIQDGRWFAAETEVLKLQVITSHNYKS